MSRRERYAHTTREKEEVGELHLLADKVWGHEWLEPSYVPDAVSKNSRGHVSLAPYNRTTQVVLGVEVEVTDELGNELHGEIHGR